MRSDLIAAIDRLGKTDKASISFLGDNLSNRDFLIRAHSRYAMRNLGLSKRTLQNKLIPALQSKDVVVLKSTAQWLQSLGRLARPAKPGLEKLLAHANEGVRFRAAAALYRSSDESADYVPALIESLDAKDASIRREAIESLTQYGPAPKLAIPALFKRLGDADKNVVAAAVDALRTAREQ